MNKQADMSYLKHKEEKANRLDYYKKLPYTRMLRRCDSGTWFIMIKELWGCMSVGDTPEEALSMIDDALIAWIDTAIDMGLDIPEPENTRKPKPTYDPEKYPKMYILVKDTIPLGLAMNAVGHAALGCYLKFKDDPIMEEWLATSFRKVTCRVTEKEFQRAKERAEDHIVTTELALNKAETAIAFKPAKEFSKFFKFLKLYK